MNLSNAGKIAWGKRRIDSRSTFHRLPGTDICMSCSRKRPENRNMIYLSFKDRLRIFLFIFIVALKLWFPLDFVFPGLSSLS